MSGLAAGIRLAYYDQRVCILERHTTIGGLNSFYRLGGRNYDVGLHAVTNFTPKGTRKGPLARLLRQLRFNWDDFSLVAADSARRSPFPACRCRSTTTSSSFAPKCTAHFPAEKDNFERLAELGRRLRRPGRGGRRPLGPLDRLVRSSAIRCWSTCSSAR